ncbi:MAG TPA: lipocalin family protein [Ohtaekwangia sp.]|uniref:lipocalin family protein n=1 Tax=Ohtaekwangia sp. TaxID=2066019 RepID=UPI002F941256
MKKFIPLSLVLVTLLVASCSDDKDATPSNTDLIAKNWVISKYEIEVGGQVVDYTDEEMTACEGDNVVTLTKDGKYTQTVGTNTCNGDETEESGTWSFKNNEKTLSLSSSNDSRDFTISVLNATTLRLLVDEISYDTNGDGVNDSKVPLYAVLAVK